MTISWTAIPASMHLLKSMGATQRQMDRLRRELEKELVKEAEIQKRMFLKTTETWEEHHPDFKIDLEYEGGNDIIARIWTDDKIYWFLDRGTSVRYATMTNDFRPKTKVRTIGSGPGSGELAYVSKKRPRPGIEARRWTDEIFDRRRNIFVRRLANITMNAVRRFTEGKY